MAEQDRLCQEYAALLHKTLEDLHKYDELRDAASREAHIQHLISSIEFALEELNPALKTPHHASAQSDPLLSRVPVLIQPRIEIPLYAEIKTRLLEKIQARQNDPLLLHAAAGLGKSQLAVQLANDPDIRQKFSDGIFWISLGSHPDVLTLQHMLIRRLNQNTPSQFLESEEATQNLWELLAGRSCLLILDDVWNVEDIGPFNCIGPQCQWMITTRNPDLCGFVKYIGKNTQCYDLTPLPVKAATQLLLSCAGQAESAEPSKAVSAVVAWCGGVPQALCLAAAAAGAAAPDWSRILTHLSAPACDFPEEYPPKLMQALHLAVEDLGEEADYYLVLAVFANYRQIPLHILLMLWQHMFQLDEKTAHTLLAEYARKSLLHLHHDGIKTFISLHTFQYAYLAEFAELDKLHLHLLSAYRRQCPQGWAHGPDDGYFLQHLPLHLASAGRSQELKSLLLDFDWLSRKLEATSLHEVLGDYQLLQDQDFEKVYRALFAAAPILFKDSSFLAHELLENLWKDAPKDIQFLLNQAREVEPDWTPAIPGADQFRIK